jgi:hypothetical protein
VGRTRAVVTGSCLVTLLTGCGATHREASPAAARRHVVVVLRRGEEKDLVRRSAPPASIRCLSHGVAITTEPPSEQAGATSSRVLWKRGKNGTASLTISSSARGRLHAACS